MSSLWFVPLSLACADVCRLSPAAARVTPDLSCGDAASEQATWVPVRLSLCVVSHAAKTNVNRSVPRLEMMMPLPDIAKRFLLSCLQSSYLLPVRCLLNLMCHWPVRSVATSPAVTLSPVITLSLALAQSLAVALSPAVATVTVARVTLPSVIAHLMPLSYLLPLRRRVHCRTPVVNQSPTVAMSPAVVPSSVAALSFTIALSPTVASFFAVALSPAVAHAQSLDAAPSPAVALSPVGHVALSSTIT